MKPIFFLIIVFAHSGFIFAQKGQPVKGSSIFVLQANTDPDSKAIVNETLKQLQRVGYWKVVANKKEADIIMDLDVHVKRGVTGTSWGGKSVQISATLQTTGGRDLEIRNL